MNMDIERAIRMVKSLDCLTLGEAIDAARDNLTEMADEESRVVYQRAVDLCYDRTLCEWLGIEYSRMDDVDLAKATLCAYYEVKGR